MKKLLILFFLLVVCAASSYSQSKFGLGIILGEPTGLSAKLYLDNTSSVDAAIGWSNYRYSAMHIHADYLYNITKLSSEVPLYVGIGGRIKIKKIEKNQDTKLAVRIPVGITYEPTSKPIDLFIEIVPMMDLTPSTEFIWNAGAGIRYYFN